MDTWTPDDEDEFYEPLEDDQPSTPIAFVSTQQSVQLSVTEIVDERTPEDMSCMGTFFGERLIARSIVPPEALAELDTEGLFQDPVRLGLAAIEQEPGLQCRLFALLPASQFDDDEPDEPWTSSVPKFEEALSEVAEGEEAIVPLLLGHIVRFAKDRKHPEDLASEAADVLRAILSEDRPLMNLVDKLLEDL